MVLGQDSTLGTLKCLSNCLRLSLSDMDRFLLFIRLKKIPSTQTSFKKKNQNPDET